MVFRGACRIFRFWRIGKLIKKRDGVPGLFGLFIRYVFQAEQRGRESWVQSSGERVSMAKVAIVLQPVQVAGDQGLWNALFGQACRAGKFDTIRQLLHDILYLYIITIYRVFQKGNYFLAPGQFFVYLSENTETA